MIFLSVFRSDNDFLLEGLTSRKERVIMKPFLFVKLLTSDKEENLYAAKKNPHRQH